jgi:ABC-type molybdate transport system ATPase subunit
VALTMSIARFVVCLRDGRIHSQGAANEVLVDEVDVSHELEKQQAQIKSELVAGEAEHVSTPSVAGAEQGKLVVAEEKNEGRVSFKSFRLFLDLVAGPVPFLFWALYLIGAVGALAALTLEPWCA